MTDLSDAAAREAELAEKNRIIAHLTKTLSHTRGCLEIARTALESIAEDSNKGDLREVHARCREIAAETLGRI